MVLIGAYKKDTTDVKILQQKTKLPIIPFVKLALSRHS